jgi:crossover junction endodeoxyribonuclease RusA
MIFFTVFGHPEPQGSTRAFIPRGWKRPIITSDNKSLKPWRQELMRSALEANRGGLIERETPVCVRLDFYLERPASLAKKYFRPVKKPDVDKLIRAVFDSLTGTLIVDDSQIVKLIVSKYFGTPERVEIQLNKIYQESQQMQLEDQPHISNMA